MEVVLPIVMYGSVLAYPLLQIAALWRCRGGARIAAGLPLLVMVPVGITTYILCMRESNLWPLYLLFASPVAVLYLVGVLVMGGGRRQAVA